MPSRLRYWLKNVFDIACILLVVTAAKSAIAEPYYVPSGSMEPTLLIGDELLATKYPYGYGSASLPVFIDLPSSGRVFAALPKRGDIVVFRWPGDRSQIWVKRVIGLPGDRVALREGRVWIDSAPLDVRADGVGEAESEDGALQPAARFIETLPNGPSHAILKLLRYGMLDTMAETVVPPDHLFVMGDNRDNSADSRVPLRSGGVGMLPVENLVGRVEGIVGSWDLAVKQQPLWNWPQGLRLSRFFSAVR